MLVTYFSGTFVVLFVLVGMGGLGTHLSTLASSASLYEWR